MQPENSTNVRPTIPSWLTRGLRALSSVAPHAAGAVAARLFLRAPPRRTSGKRELDVLLQADRFDAEFDGETLQAYLWGQGPAVLLLHGWGGSAGQLYPFVDPLVQAGFSVVAFDAPAHGASTGSWLAIPRYAAAIQRLSEQLGPLHAIIAHSMGGPAASLALSQGLSAGRFVQIGPPADALAWFMTFSRALGLTDEVTGEARRAIEQRAGMGLQQLNAAAVGPSLQLPLLVIHDRDDREVPWTDGAAVANAAPNATLTFTEGLGHRRILRDPEVVRRTLAFLGEPERAQLFRPLQLPRAVA